MAEKTQCRVGAELTLRDPAGQPVVVREVSLELVADGGQFVEARLLFQLSPAEYQALADADRFNLRPEVRGPIFAGGFLPEPDVELETRLKPELLPQLQEECEDVFDAAARILGKTRREVSHPLAATESYLALYVKQARGPIKSGFKTTWAD